MVSLTAIHRRRYGIIFNFSPRWMGGVIYILNLIRTLDFLDDDEKPEITLFYRSDLRQFVDEINYPYLKTIEWTFPSVYKGYIKSWLFRKNFFVDDILKQYDIDILYPIHDFPVKTKSKTRLICWYADLQHLHYPEFFTARKILERNFRIRFMLRNCRELVTSSQAVANDFTRFYKIPGTLRLHVFHFVSVIEDISGVNINDLRKKYKLPEKYFMISNQFHKHKNHEILFKSLALMKQKGNPVHFAVSGKFPEAVSSPYIMGLHKIIDENKLQDHISFLGVIPRIDQLALMRYSRAVIQPSFFEGWSTVIEDARSLQVPVIASRLEVNVEQLGEGNFYFDPDSPDELALILMNYPERNMNDIFFDNYYTRTKGAAKALVQIFDGN